MILNSIKKKEGLAALVESSLIRSKVCRGKNEFSIILLKGRERFLPGGILRNPIPILRLADSPLRDAGTILRVAGPLLMLSRHYLRSSGQQRRLGDPELGLSGLPVYLRYGVNGAHPPPDY